MAKLSRVDIWYRGIKFWLKRNQWGLVIGSLIGILIFYMFWNTLGYENILKWLVYPFTLIFGCEIPFWSVILFAIFYGLIGASIDSFLSKQVRDKRRAFVLLLILLLLILTMHFYRVNISEDFCQDIDRDGIPDDTIPDTSECTINEDCDSGEICSNNVCIDTQVTECTSDSDCDTDEVCTNDICVPSGDPQIQFEVSISTN